jgi:hypothetical protein
MRGKEETRNNHVGTDNAIKVVLNMAGCERSSAAHYSRESKLFEFRFWGAPLMSAD